MLDALKTILETMFRFFPFPIKTGLQVIGQPGPEAPVLVTCNFDLTVRRVMKALDGLDCYLLVAPSKGINVWCASGGGVLSAHSVTSVLKTSRIGQRVQHRTLILPQLAAPGIDIARVERETGWHCQFGPVYARDIRAYLAAGCKKAEAMCEARFPLADRLEMAVMWATPMSLVAGIPVAMLNVRLLPGVLALIWGFSLFLFAFYGPVVRVVPGPMGLVKTWLLGLIGVVGVVAYGLGIGDWGAGSIIGWSLGVIVTATVLGFDLDGSSPLNAGASVAYWGRKWPPSLKLWAKIGYELEPWFSLEVLAERCSGCTTCASVCPKGVFELYLLDGNQKSRVARSEACEQCTACVKQCPQSAIVADPPIRTFA